jgi:alkanesulfonate monooxygenase SsuD/methylene tetrahydromethanopterin reductase-like flavin-dependent oxidoreductase (luciferase family)
MAPAGIPRPGVSRARDPLSCSPPPTGADLAVEAERGLLDFATFEDALSLQSADRARPDERTDQVCGRLDAVLTAARVAALTRHIGLIPAVAVTYTEPFHISRFGSPDPQPGGRVG